MRSRASSRSRAIQERFDGGEVELGLCHAGIQAKRLPELRGGLLTTPLIRQRQPEGGRPALLGSFRTALELGLSAGVVLRLE